MRVQGQSAHLSFRNLNAGSVFSRIESGPYSQSRGRWLMSKYHAEDHHARVVERLLHARKLSHLRARKYGTTVIVESGPKDDPVKHLRLTRQGTQLWLLDIADHRGRWERTPDRGSPEELITLVVEQFPWTLQSLDDYPERTSDL